VALITCLNFWRKERRYARLCAGDNKHLKPLSKHRSMAAAERTKAIHIRIDRLIKAGRQRREAR
jgi:hypothetical protein